MTVVPLTEHGSTNSSICCGRSPTTSAWNLPMRRPSNGCATMRSALAPLKRCPTAWPRFQGSLALNSKGKAVGYATWFHVFDVLASRRCTGRLVRSRRFAGIGRGVSALRARAHPGRPARLRAHGVAGARLEYAGPRVLSPSPGDVDEAGWCIGSHTRCKGCDRTARSVREVRAVVLVACWTFCTDGGSSFEPTSVRRLHRLASGCLHRLAELSIGRARCRLRLS